MCCGRNASPLEKMLTRALNYHRLRGVGPHYSNANIDHSLLFGEGCGFECGHRDKGHIHLVLRFLPLLRGSSLSRNSWRSLPMSTPHLQHTFICRHTQQTSSDLAERHSGRSFGSLRPEFVTSSPSTLAKFNHHHHLPRFPSMEEAATLVQALYRGHRVRIRIWHEPKAAFISLAARLDAECGFRAPTNFPLGPSPSDQVLLRLNMPHQTEAGFGTFCTTNAEEACEISKVADDIAVTHSTAWQHERPCRVTSPAISTQSIPPMRPAPTQRRREDILMELQWVNTSLKERLRVRQGCKNEGWGGILMGKAM